MLVVQFWLPPVFGALIAPGFELAEHDRPALVLIAICLAGLGAARLAFVRSQRRPAVQDQV